MVALLNSLATRKTASVNLRSVADLSTAIMAGGSVQGCSQLCSVMGMDA